MLNIVREYGYYSDRRFTTLAGTLVYFLIMSITPFLFLLALIVGDVDLSPLTSNKLLSSVRPSVEYLLEAAGNATKESGIILAITSIWSSTNFFYHLRRSGELIFAPGIKTNFIKLRIISLASVITLITFLGIVAALPFIGEEVLVVIMPQALAESITLAFMTMFSYFLSLFLNAFACPYRLCYGDLCGGAMLTLILWIICAAGFTVYLRFANPQKLYGAIAAIVVFLLWCYLMVNSLIIGIIYNRKHSRPPSPTERGGVSKLLFAD